MLLTSRREIKLGRNNITRCAFISNNAKHIPKCFIKMGGGIAAKKFAVRFDKWKHPFIPFFKKYQFKICIMFMLLFPFMVLFVLLWFMWGIFTAVMDSEPIK